MQNRFYPDTAYEAPLRKYCRENDIIFQSFWTLTGNPKLAQSAPVKSLQAELSSLGIEDPNALALYSLVLGLGSVTVLDGTTRELRMKGDLEGLQKIGRWIEGEGKEQWKKVLGEFQRLVGDA